MEIFRLFLDHLLTVVGFLLALLLVTRILKEKRQPGSTIAWLMAIVLIPYVGVPLYLIFGGRKLNRFIRMKGKLHTTDGSTSAAMPPPVGASRVVMDADMPPPRPGNHLAQHSSGESAFHATVRLCESAQECIHIATFILGRDETGRALVDLLARKAREGVQVRLLLDGLGCLYSSGRFVQPLRDAGGQVGRFMPVLPVRRRWSANLRNHRKIIVVDHAAAMVGGMNLRTDFMGPTPNPRRFIDTAVFLCGPAVEDIERVFFDDWDYVSGEDLESRTYERSNEVAERLSHLIAAPEAGAPLLRDSVIQVIPSGPDVPEDTFHDALITAIMEARRRIWLVTPYFIPDEALVKTLALKARSGCDVRILTPLRSNHPTADLGRGPAFREISAAGATIYAYPDGMVHAKMMLFDDSLAITGSPNLDMRSIYLSFEIALFHYSQADLSQMEKWIRSMQQAARILTPEQVSNERAWAENFCRLISPLL